MKRNSPIKEIEVIRLVKDLYLNKKQYRNYLLFVLAINTGLNLKDLLNLKVKDVKNKQYLTYEKNKSIPLSLELRSYISTFIKGRNQEELLFKNSLGNSLDRTTVFHSFKVICSELGIQNKYSVASWRKTFGYHFYQKYKDLSYLQWLFNQSKVEETLKFIDVEENMNLRIRGGIEL